MGRCIFCDQDLAPGSKEHVFLSALGGRVATRQATCVDCNNRFAAKAGDNVDDALAESFIVPRSALMIWTGRDRPPPTIRQAGILPSGHGYDLAPGFVPMPCRTDIPKISTGPVQITAKDVADGKRIMTILRAKGYQASVTNAERVIQKAPPTNLSISFDGPVIFRSIAKAALAGACLMHGNSVVLQASDKRLREAVFSGKPLITEFAGWDYVNPWPGVVSLSVHRRSSDPTISGFEHSLITCDVDSSWVGYLTLFGDFRFSVWLGPAIGLPSRGLAVNPRSRSLSRFEYVAAAPTRYARRNVISLKTEQSTTMSEVGSSFNRVLDRWSNESRSEWFGTLTEELVSALGSTNDENEREGILRNWCEKVAVLEGGDAWKQALDETLVDDE